MTKQNTDGEVKLKHMLTEFFIAEIAEKAIDGVTYSMFIDNNKNKEQIETYLKIREHVTDMNLLASKHFRKYKVSNGYIFDMDLNEALSILCRILTHKLKNDPTDDKSGKDYIIAVREKALERRKRDLEKLGDYIMNKVTEAKDKQGGEIERMVEVEVALFSRNSTNEIKFAGINSNNEKIDVKYKAFAVRHGDIEKLNREILMPQGYIVRRERACEILPSQNGVSFVLTIDKLADAE